MKTESRFDLFLAMTLSLLTACQAPEQHNHMNAPAKVSGVMLNDSQMKLANIAVQKVSRHGIGQSVALTAKLSVDEDHSKVITSRAAGRIEKLLIKETGRTVNQGELLYTIYSETLLTLQREYLLAKEQYETLGKTEKRYESFYKASEQKLLLYGFSKEAINQLAQSKLVQSSVGFFAPSPGLITEINASEGSYISEGAPLYKIEDTRTLWVEAELYPQETFVKIGDPVNVIVAGFENSPAVATVSFLSPEYRSGTQLIVLRAKVENPGLTFSPGMQAQVIFTHSTKQSLSIPIDAVIRDGKGTHVYIQKGGYTFEPRDVKTGLEDFDQVEILDGLTENDTIAVSGVYLLYSEISNNQ